jgi:peroxiredoxin
MMIFNLFFSSKIASRFVLGLLLIICYFVQGFAQDTTVVFNPLAEAEKEMIGQTAPDFELTTLKGKKVKLSALRGKIVVLNFWYLGCAPCVREFPQLNELVAQFKKKKVVFLAISVSGRTEAIGVFLKRKPLDYQVIASDFTVAKQYKVMLYPTNLVIDKEGIIRYVKVAYDEQLVEKMQKEIKKLL